MSRLRYDLRKSHARLKAYASTRKHQRLYRQQLATLTPARRQPNVKAAVVLHLYYLEAWKAFKAKLRVLDARPHDLFITMPQEHEHFAAEIKSDYPSAQIILVPNRGRDVLPFVQLAAVLDTMGYDYVLKLHSKKSTHRTDGAEWLAGMTEDLLPANSKVLGALLAKLEDPSTGVVGPQGHYTSLAVNFEANGVHITNIITKAFSSQISKRFEQQRSQYGFFAGTMFWVRLDAIRPLLAQRFAIGRYELEKGQIDGTFAHALERALCLAVEAQNKDIYQVSKSDLKKVDYNAGEIPDWSDVYIGPKG